LLLAEDLAERLGFAVHLDPEDVELENLRLRIAWGLVSFNEVRAFVAARLRPIG
jgi:hypothetical protein